MTRKMLRVLDCLAVGLVAGIAAYGVNEAWKYRQMRQAQAVAIAAKPRIGSRVESLVVSDADGRNVPLSDVQPGSCRYVVVGSRYCPHTARAADLWAVTALNEPTGADMPPGWHALWVLTDEQSGRDGFLDSAFPSATYFAGNANDVISGTGIRYTPSYLVLDRDGRVAEVGAGGRLLPTAAFLDNCSIDKNVGNFRPPEVTQIARAPDD